MNFNFPAKMKRAKQEEDCVMHGRYAVYLLMIKR